jgi:sporulation protein YabP
LESKDIKVEDKKSSLKLDNRKKLSLSGVVEVISFNDENIILNTNLGTLTIKGEGLKMNKLDVQNGEVMITGIVNSCIYTTNEVKKDKDSIISRLFK